MWLQRRSSIKFIGVERAACHEHRGREFVRGSGVCSPGDFEICMVSPRMFELTSMLLLRTFALFIFVEAIDVIHKWLPIHYSFVLVQISLPSLIVMC